MSLALSLCSVKGVLVIFQVNKIHMYQMIHNQMNSKAHFGVALKCVSHLYGLNDNAKGR